MDRRLYGASWLVAALSLLGCPGSSPDHRPPAADGGRSGESGNSAGRVGASEIADAGPPAFDDTRAPLARSMIAPDTTPSISDSDYATFIAHIDQFGLDLGQKMASDNQLTTGNLVYSPLSVSYALAMTYAGARGQTASEMKSVLGDSFDDGVFHRGANLLARELALRAVTIRPDSDGNPHRIELSLVDSIFAEKTLGLQPAFLDLLGSEYDSGVRQVDFKHAFEAARIAIDDWVADQTKDKIVDLLPVDSLDTNTRVVLVNALYFYGTWSTPFKPSNTKAAPFHRLVGDTVQVTTMSAELAARSGRDADFEVAELPYEGGHIRMTIVLPAEGQFEAVRSQVSSAWLEHAVGLLSPMSLSVQLPKFKFSSGSFSLKKGLQDLGMSLAFSNGADFSGISGDERLKIKDVWQQAFVAVDENGTEASAATAVVIERSFAFVQSPRPFIIDRPFLFFIRDDGGAVLFSGQVVDPSQ